MSWVVEFTDEFGHWWQGLDRATQNDITAAVEILEQHGPSLGRPLVDTLAGSRRANLKELRISSSNIRILFAFDPRRVAILLLGGDKTGSWSAWYEEHIPEAERLLEDHLEALRKEGLSP